MPAAAIPSDGEDVVPFAPLATPVEGLPLPSFCPLLAPPLAEGEAAVGFAVAVDMMMFYQTLNGAFC